MSMVGEGLVIGWVASAKGSSQGLFYHFSVFYEVVDIVALPSRIWMKPFKVDEE